MPEEPRADPWAPSRWDATGHPDGGRRTDTILDRWPGPSRPVPKDEWFAISRRLRKRDELTVAAELGTAAWFFVVFFWWLLRGDLVLSNLVGVPLGATVAGAYAFRAKPAWDGTRGQSLLAPSLRDANWARTKLVLETALGASGLELKERSSGREKYSGNYLLWRLGSGMRIYVRDDGRWGGTTIQLLSGDATTVEAFVSLKGALLESLIRERDAPPSAAAGPIPRVVE